MEGSHFPTQQGTCPKNQGAVLRREVYEAHFSTRQSKNVRRPISSAHFTLDVNGYPVVSPNGQGALCCVVYPKINVKHENQMEQYTNINSQAIFRTVIIIVEDSKC